MVDGNRARDIMKEGATCDDLLLVGSIVHTAFKQFMVMRSTGGRVGSVNRSSENMLLRYN